VGIAVPFTVPVIGLSVGYKVGQFLQQVMADIRIGILIDGHACSGVGHKDRDRTRCHSSRSDNFPNLVRDIHQLAPRLCRNLNRIHKISIIPMEAPLRDFQFRTRNLKCRNIEFFASFANFCSNSSLLD
jgi:hypothetical protein